MYILLVVGILIAFVSPCLPASPWEKKGEKIEIRTIGIPPYGVSKKKPSGIYYETANLLAKEAGYRVNNFIYPYARIINEIKSGETDMTIMFKYKELEDHVIYVAPLTTLKTVVIGLKGATFDSVSSLKGRSLAYLRGAKFSDIIDKDPEITKQVTNDFIQGIKMLMFGRVDAIIGPLDPIIAAAKGITEKTVVLGEPLIVAERTPWVQISKKSIGRISVDRLQTTFMEIKKRGSLREIRHKYINDVH